MLLGLKARFEPMVVDGSKRHTIRALRKRRFRVGDICDCYVNPRQKSMRLLGRWTCTRVQDVVLVAEYVNRKPLSLIVTIDGDELSESETSRLCWADGFRSRPEAEAWIEFCEFWRSNHRKRIQNERLAFHGQLIHWDYDHPVTERFKRKRPRARVMAVGSTAVETSVPKRPLPATGSVAKKGGRGHNYQSTTRSRVATSERAGGRRRVAVGRAQERES